LERKQVALIWKAGIMAIVVAGGDVRLDDPMSGEVPPEPHRTPEVV
jgi:MOSC domain-containing protein YiiM